MLSRGAKLSPLFALLFRRTSSQHPLVAGALGRSSVPSNCYDINLFYHRCI